MLKRLFAVLTTAALALGLSLGATVPASANGETCNSIGYTKIDEPSGSETFTWGELAWSGQSLSYTLGEGWSVDLCIKSGAQAGTTTYQDLTGTGTRTIVQDISHIGYKDPTRANGLTCDAATLYKTSPLTNGDHVNMDVVIDGVKQQVNAYVDLWQAGGPTPKLSNLVLTITPQSGAQFKASIPQTSIDSGILAFEYSSGWAGSWTVEWVQYNTSYFNQDRNPSKFLNCPDTPVVISTAPSATAPTCDADGGLVLPIAANITWSGGNNGDGPGVYTIVATPASGYTLNGAQNTWVIQVLPKGTGLSCGPPPCIAANDVDYTYAADCDDPVEYVKPAVTPEACDGVLGGEKDGIVTFTLPEHLTYVFDGTPVTAADLSIEKPAGSYTLVVTADPGYFIAGGGTTETFTITVDPAIDCDDVTIIPLDPFASPEECVAGSLDGDNKNGTITIVKAEHVTWQISNDIDGIKHPVDTSGVGPNFVFDYPAGDYRVWATADPGYVITTPTSFALTVHEPTLDCGLPTFAQLPTGASWTQQVCTATGIVDPTITVEPSPGVSYFLDGVKMAQASVTVKPGSYTLTAAADDPTNTVSTAAWPTIVLAASSSVCGDLTTLALTGETPGGWLVLALVLFQGGLVLVAFRFLKGSPRHAG